jgi:hypothetical protein
MSYDIQMTQYTPFFDKNLETPFAADVLFFFFG